MLLRMLIPLISFLISHFGVTIGNLFDQRPAFPTHPAAQTYVWLPSVNKWQALSNGETRKLKNRAIIRIGNLSAHIMLKENVSAL